MKYLRREKYEIPRIGWVEIREMSGREALQYDREHQAAEDSVAEWDVLCSWLARLVTDPEGLDVGELPVECVLALQRGMFAVSKIDAPHLEQLKEGEEYVSHVEDTAEDFSETQTADSGTGSR